MPGVREIRFQKISFHLLIFQVKLIKILSAKPGNIAGYFGKLPGFNDFVKYNAGGEEVLVLDKWLQDGLIAARMKLKSAWVNLYKNSEELYFFNPFTGTGRALTGIIFFSTDKSGREFPFIIFFYLDKKLLNNIPVHLIPVVSTDTLNELKSAVNDLTSINNLSNLNERLNQISYNSGNIDNYRSIYHDYLISTPQTDFWDRVTGEYDNMQKLSVLTNLHPGKASTGPVKIPFVSHKDHLLNDITFLLHLTFTFQTVYESFPVLFWTGHENINHFLYIIKNKPLPEYFIELINRQNDNNLTEKINNASVINSVENLFKKDITLKEFLNAIQ